MSKAALPDIRLNLSHQQEHLSLNVSLNDFLKFSSWIDQELFELQAQHTNPMIENETSKISRESQIR